MGKKTMSETESFLSFVWVYRWSNLWMGYGIDNRRLRND